MTVFSWLALMPLAPLLGAAYNGILGYRMQARFGRAAVHVPAILAPAVSLAVTIFAFVKLLGLPHDARVLYCHLWPWVSIGPIDAGFALIMDPLTLVMCSVITFVGTLIHVYSVGYMRDEPSYWRFFCYLNLFLFAMLLLVLGDNFLVMFIGWEGVGLCSYLLIGFWYKETKNAVAGMKAFVVNRVGDFGFILGLMLLFWGMQGVWDEAGTFETRALPAGGGKQEIHSREGHATAHVSESHGNEPDAHLQDSVPPADAEGASHASEPQVAVSQGDAPEAPAGDTSVTFRRLEERLADPAVREALVSRKVFGVSLVTLVGILFFVGAMGKSAQIPLYVWLPDAMAGPTPVSALIHAATMVTAGVYMVARLHFLYALSPFVMTWVAVVGAATAVFAATIGFFQYDIKKVLAYSTVSQLGFMFIAVGVGAYGVGIFHVMTHAFFKACLFLGSGSVILGCHHEQDMRKMGGLRKCMPLTSATYFAACCAIAGFPLTSGFFSKDEILWKAFDAGNLLLPGGGILIWALAAVGAACTSFYMFRSYYMTFSGEYRGGEGHGHGAHGVDHGAGTSGHGHATRPHESPATMTLVLVVLAALSLVGGAVGLPHIWHLPNYLHHWLAPVFETSEGLVTAAGHSSGAEWALMIASIGLAFGGWAVARWLYRDAVNPLPQRLLDAPNPLLRRVHRVIFNKYYVDEFYAAFVVAPAMRLRLICDAMDRRVVDGLVNLAGPIARGLARLHGMTDVNVVDGAVNGAAQAIAAGGSAVRRTQTGNIRTYLYVMVVGGVALLLVTYLLTP